MGAVGASAHRSRCVCGGVMPERLPLCLAGAERQRNAVRRTVRD